jgi:hypothetical protein
VVTPVKPEFKKNDPVVFDAELAAGVVPVK